jgi:magnesium chelatase subunit D
MNPEEGELRPQLLDRFGITVEVAGSPDPAERVEVVRRRLHHEADPRDFAAKWSGADAELAASVETARRRLPGVRLGDETLLAISTLCAELGVDGLRGDIVTARTARTLAAWEARDEVDLDDVKRAALLALSHRRRRGPFESPGVDPEEIEAALRGPEHPRKATGKRPAKTGARTPSRPSPGPAPGRRATRRRSRSGR